MKIRNYYLPHYLVFLVLAAGLKQTIVYGGFINLVWYINEIAAVFLGDEVLLSGGFIGKIGPNKMAQGIHKWS